MSASTLALISGKGGSGKTTLSLLIAGLMSSCGLKTLLVDCDMATHGLTYFFENELDERVSPVTEYAWAGPKRGTEVLPYINIDELSACIPSVYRVASAVTMGLADCQSAISNIMAEFSNEFDLIVFDGQAGYSPFVQAMVNVADATLFVMELDAVSVSANRVLYRQLCIGDSRGVNERGLYQVINKLDEEDREVFSQVLTGTMFENLPPVGYSLMVRRAFAECRIPSMSNAGVGLAYDVGGIVKRMFTVFRKRIDQQIYDDSKAYKSRLEKDLTEVRRYRILREVINLAFVFEVPLLMAVLVYVFRSAFGGDWLITGSSRYWLLISILFALVLFISYFVLRIWFDWTRGRERYSYYTRNREEGLREQLDRVQNQLDEMS